MKRASFILLFLFASRAALALSHAQADSIGLAAQQAYASADYQTALVRFDSVAAEYRSPSLCLALGNTHYKLGDVAKAILWYERGLRLAPADGDLRANLDIANEQVRDRLPAVPGIALGSTWDALRGNDPDRWARIALWTCLLLFGFLALVRLTKGGVRQMGWALSAISLLLLLGSLLMAFARHREIDSDSEAILMVAKMEARSEPRETGKALFVLHRGAKVTVSSAVEGWCEVRLPNGATGWMPATAVERI